VGGIGLKRSQNGCMASMNCASEFREKSGLATIKYFAMSIKLWQMINQCTWKV